MKRPEKISRHERSSGMKKTNKKIATRARRRLDKKDPENSLKKNHYFGWTD